jgi:Skp family chaperone for outer membrane proteins
MRTILKLMTAAAIAAPLAIAAPASAQVAVADLNAAVDQSAAIKTAATTIQTQYKTQIDAFNARQQALQTQLQPLAQELQTLQANPATAPATLQTKAQAFQARRDAAQKELAGLSAPFQRPLAYAQEQVVDKLDAAVRAAMTAKNVTVLLRPDSVFTALPAGDLTPDIVAQLNNAVKTVSTTPPAGWQPGQQQAAAGGAAPAPRPATPAPTQGR